MIANRAFNGQDQPLLKSDAQLWRVTSQDRLRKLSASIHEVALAAVPAVPPPVIAPPLPRAIEVVIADIARDPQSRQRTLAYTHNGQSKLKKVAFPSWEFLGAEKAIAQKSISDAINGVPTDAGIVFSGDTAGYSTAEILPGRLTARSFDKSVRFLDQHVHNLNTAANAHLSVERTVFFNFVSPPQDPSLGQKKKWAKIRNSYDVVADRIGLVSHSSKVELLAALTSGRFDTLIVVAHGDQRSIYLPSGEKITVDDLSSLTEIRSGKPPLVILVSCTTGRFSGDGVQSFAQALLQHGRAVAVVAPVRQVEAGPQTAEFIAHLFKVSSKAPLENAFRGLRGPWQLYVLRDMSDLTAVTNMLAKLADRTRREVGSDSGVVSLHKNEIEDIEKSIEWIAND